MKPVPPGSHRPMQQQGSFSGLLYTRSDTQYSTFLMCQYLGIRKMPLIILRMTFKGIHKGRFFDTDATGREIAWAGAAFFRTEGDKIIELWVLGDIDGVKRQLGAPAGASFLPS